MAKRSKRKTGIKEEPKIILFTAALCGVLCLLYSLLVRSAVVSYVYSLEGQTYIRSYMRQYIAQIERLEDGTDEELVSDIFGDREDVINWLYSTFNDKSAQMETGFELPGGAGVKFPLYRYGSAVWIADRSTGEPVIRSDYIVLWEGKKRMLCDIRACYSDGELYRICGQYYKTLEKFGYVDDFSEIGLYYPRVEKYILRDGIAYPLVIVFDLPDEKIVFDSDMQFEYEPSEVVETDECILVDDMLDPANPDFLKAKRLSDSNYDRFAEDTRNLPTDNIHDFARGYIVKVTSEITDRYVICQTEIINYRGMLNAATAAGCIVIILICTIIAHVLCKRAKLKRERVEYERSVTNALAHNYKSSLMVLRSCAENLRAGISEEKREKYEQKIMDETDRMSEAAEKILSFYRTGAAGYEAKAESIDVKAVCNALIGKYDKETESRKLTWEVDESEKSDVTGDPVLFTMALDNLIGNAAGYALPGSVIKIGISRGRMTLTNSWNPVDKFIKKPKLFFEAFVTGDDNAGRTNSGIGLKVTKDLLERMGLGISAKADNEKVTFEIK